MFGLPQVSFGAGLSTPFVAMLDVALVFMVFKSDIQLRSTPTGSTCPPQYDKSVPASLMVFNDGQAFMDMNGNVRAPNVLDNLIYRREIPVMIGGLHQSGAHAGAARTELGRPGRRTGRPSTTRSTISYARVIVDELLPTLYKEYNLSKDPGAAASAAAAPARSPRSPSPGSGRPSSARSSA